MVSANGSLIHYFCRTLQLVEEPLIKGRTFKFRVNGVDIFAKGSNWIPAHVLPGKHHYNFCQKFSIFYCSTISIILLPTYTIHYLVTYHARTYTFFPHTQLVRTQENNLY